MASSSSTTPRTVITVDLSQHAKRRDIAGIVDLDCSNDCAKLKVLSILNDNPYLVPFFHSKMSVATADRHTHQQWILLAEALARVANMSWVNIRVHPRHYRELDLQPIAGDHLEHIREIWGMPSFVRLDMGAQFVLFAAMFTFYTPPPPSSSPSPSHPSHSSSPVEPLSAIFDEACHEPSIRDICIHGMRMLMDDSSRQTVRVDLETSISLYQDFPGVAEQLLIDNLRVLLANDIYYKTPDDDLLRFLEEPRVAENIFYAILADDPSKNDSHALRNILMLSKIHGHHFRHPFEVLRTTDIPCLNKLRRLDIVFKEHFHPSETVHLELLIHRRREKSREYGLLYTDTVEMIFKDLLMDMDGKVHEDNGEIEDDE